MNNKKKKKMTQITAKSIADPFNELFFDKDGKQQQAKVTVFIQQGDKQIFIPNTMVSPSDSLYHICNNAAQYLKENGPIVVKGPGDIEKIDVQDNQEAVKEEVEEKELNLIKDFEKIYYKDTPYFVEVDQEDNIIVLNESREKSYDAKSPLYRTIVKMYKELRGITD